MERSKGYPSTLSMVPWGKPRPMRPQSRYFLAFASASLLWPTLESVRLNDRARAG